MNAAKTGMRSVVLFKSIDHQRRREFMRRQQTLGLDMQLYLHVVSDDPSSLNGLVPVDAKIAALHHCRSVPSSHYGRSVSSGHDRPLRTSPLTLTSKFHL